MKKRNKIALFIVSLLIMLGLTVVPIPYYIEQPGSTINLNQLITVDKKKDTEKGSISLTSVGIRRATILSALLSKTSSFNELLSEKELMGTSTSDEYNQMQKFYMESAQNNASELALKKANIPYKMNYKGVYVMSIEKNSNFYGKLKVGDIVTGVDDQTFSDSQNLLALVRSKNKDDMIKVNYIQDGEMKEATGKMIPLPKTSRIGIGITLVDHTEITSSKSIQFNVENIGGPSAGFMFALEIYQQLTNQNIRKGKDIAGTGTINSDGMIGRIGGIDKKVASASKEGAELFFAPDDELTPEDKKADPTIKSNYQEAKEAAEKLGTKMKIIPIKTFDDALNYLNQLN